LDREGETCTHGGAVVLQSRNNRSVGERGTHSLKKRTIKTTPTTEKVRQRESSTEISALSSFFAEETLKKTQLREWRDPYFGLGADFRRMQSVVSLQKPKRT